MRRVPPPRASSIDCSRRCCFLVEAEERKEGDNLQRSEIPPPPLSASVRCLLMESDKIGIVSGACWCGQHRPRDDEVGDGIPGAMTRIIAMGHVEGFCLVNREKDVCITTLADSVNHITSAGEQPTGPDYASGRVLSAPTSISPLRCAGRARSVAVVPPFMVNNFVFFFSSAFLSRCSRPT